MNDQLMRMNNTTPSEIERVEMGLLSPHVVRRLAVIEVTESTIQDKNQARSNGPNDHRIGSVDRRVLCGTCDKGPELCQGHFGVIELPVPIWNVGYMDNCLKILRCVCLFCSELLVDPSLGLETEGDSGGGEKIKDNRSKRVKLLVEDEVKECDPDRQCRQQEKRKFLTILKIMSKRSFHTCPNCGLAQPEKFARDGLSVRIEWSERARLQIKERTSSKQVVARLDESQLSALDAHQIMCAISEATCRNMGIDPETSRPEWMLHTALLVPPVAIRPSIRLTEYSKARGHDDLTNKLHEIVKHSETVKRTMRSLGLTPEALEVDAHQASWKYRRVDGLLDDTQSPLLNSTFEAWYPTSHEMWELRELARKSAASHAPKQRKVGSSTASNTRSTTDPGKPRSAETLFEQIVNLQSAVALYLNSEVKGVPKTQHGRKVNTNAGCLFKRQKHKTGRMRSSAMGKRLNFCARDVISPDANIGIGEIGIARETALALSVPVRVNDLTREECEKRVRIGPGNLDGALGIILPPGVGHNAHGTAPINIDLETLNSFERSTITLPDGALVERPLKNGDPVVYNRQPSLHRMNMMCHRVKILPGRTFRHSSLVNTSYNADFDGDEMNLHVPQAVDAACETVSIMSVDQNLITPQSNRPIIGLMQDSLVGAFLISQPDCFLEHDQVCELLAQLMPESTPQLPEPAILLPRRLWTGRQVFSALLPRGLHLEKLVRLSELGPSDPIRKKIEPEYSLEQSNVVRVVDGELVSGILCKETVGASSNGFVQVLCNDFSSERAGVFLTQAQRVLLNFVSVHSGLSVGLSDCVTPSSARARKRAFAEVAEGYLLQQMNAPGVDRSAPEVERSATQYLTTMLERVGRTIPSSLLHPTRNRLVTMTSSGAKGKGSNVWQIMGCLGNQTVEGNRLDARLPAFLPDEQGADARGWIRSSYTDGLNSREAYHHAQGGKEGLVATAVGTSKTGYMQRKLIKAMESHRVCADLTVRDADDRIVQQRYGGDGFNPMCVERCSLEALLMGDDQLESALKISPYSGFLSQCVLLS